MSTYIEPQHKGRFFSAILWMFVGACISLLVVKVQKNSSDDELKIQWQDADGETHISDVSIITWPGFSAQANYVTVVDPELVKTHSSTK